MSDLYQQCNDRLRLLELQYNDCAKRIDNLKSQLNNARSDVNQRIEDFTRTKAVYENYQGRAAAGTYQNKQDVEEQISSSYQRAVYQKAKLEASAEKNNDLRRQIAHYESMMRSAQTRALQLLTHYHADHAKWMEQEGILVAIIQENAPQKEVSMLLVESDRLNDQVHRLQRERTAILEEYDVINKEVNTTTGQEQAEDKRKHLLQLKDQWNRVMEQQVVPYKQDKALARKRFAELKKQYEKCQSLVCNPQTTQCNVEMQTCRAVEEEINKLLMIPEPTFME